MKGIHLFTLLKAVKYQPYNSVAPNSKELAYCVKAEYSDL